MTALSFFIFSLLVSTTFAIDNRENTDQVAEKEERPAFQALPLQLGGPGDKSQFYFSLFYTEVIRGKDTTSVTIAEPTPDWAGQGFGKAVVKDVPLWTNTTQKEIYARWQGVSFQSSKTDAIWHTTATINFLNKDLKGSTLEVMGHYAPFELGGALKQWAIVGGTGKFTLAQGVVYGKQRVQDENLVAVEMKMYGYRTPMEEPKW